MDALDKAKQRLSKLIYNTDDCIVTSPTNSDGYVDYQYMENGYKIHLLGHRVSYMIANNLIKLNNNDVICHKCDNRNCINPKHLFIGTHADNVNDKVLKNRQAKGISNGKYKHGYYSIYDKVKKNKRSFQELCNRSLDIDTVKVIKNAINNKIFTSLKDISDYFKIPYQTIRDIKCGKTYKNINP